MTRSIIKPLRLTMAAATITIGLFLGESAFVGQGSLVTQANAIIGRPLTPLSYAGVARRTTARAVTAGAVVGAAALAAPVVVAPACVQVADAYGRIYMSCP